MPDCNHDLPLTGTHSPLGHLIPLAHQGLLFKSPGHLLLVDKDMLAQCCSAWEQFATSACRRDGLGVPCLGMGRGDPSCLALLALSLDPSLSANPMTA